MAIAEGNGVLNAVSVVRGLKDPHLEDDLHRALIQFLYPRRYFQTENKKAAVEALDMVLYEISLPPGERRRKKKKLQRIHLRHGAVLHRNDDFKSKIKKRNISPWKSVLPTIGEEIVFYAAVPRAKSSLLEKQISALFANARIEEKREDYNIFKPGGASAGSVVKLKTYPVLPLRTYDKFDVDPMFVLANAFFQIAKSGRGGRLCKSLSARQSSYYQKIKKKTAEEIRKGKKTFRSLEKSQNYRNGRFSFIGDLIFSDSSPKKTTRKKKKSGRKKKRSTKT